MDFVTIPDSSDAIVVLAHGAGAPADSDFMTLLSSELNKHSIGVVRIEFGYMHCRRTEGKQSPPGRLPNLVEEYRQKLMQLEVHINAPLFIGGKSMGGRVASMLARKFNPDERKNRVRGVVCFGYPFHPPSKPHQVRTQHLFEPGLPIMIAQGTRDQFGKKGEVTAYELPARVKLCWLDQCDHDFIPTKRSGLTQTGQMVVAARHAREFIDSVL